MITLLLIEDYDVDRFILERSLHHIDIPVQLLHASNGAEGLKMLDIMHRKKGFLPDIILVDKHMPIMDASAFLEKYAQWQVAGKDRISLWVLTTVVREDVPGQPPGDGKINVLRKPAPIEKLREILGQHIMKVSRGGV